MGLVTTDVLLLDLKKFNLPAQYVAMYDQLRMQVEAAVKSYVKWGIEAVTDQIDYYDGSGIDALVLRRPYVSAITDIWIDPLGAYGENTAGFATGTVLVKGQDYALRVDADSGGKSGLAIMLSNPSAWLFPSDLLFYNRAGGLSYRRGAYWPPGRGNIKVKYNWGFATIPLDIQLAVCTGVSIILNSVKYGFPAQSESLGAHSYSLALSKEPEFGTVRSLLGPYRDQSL